MIPSEVFDNAVEADLFEDLSDDEKNEADIMAYVAMEIHKRRTEIGMTQEELASACGVSQAMVSRWESGDYNFSIQALSNVLKSLNENDARYY